MKPLGIGLVFLLLAQFLFAQPLITPLNQQWKFCREANNQWYPASVPGTIHTDLLYNHLIPDPFYRDNETRLHWIDSVNWDYRLEFNVAQNSFSKNYIELQLDGLDTYADLYLNGKLILQANNMFRGWTIPVKQFLKRKNNVLQIHFHSALHTVDSIAHSKLPMVLPDNNRVYARKAQFQFGWDWGPILIGCGIWKPVYLIARDDFGKKSKAPAVDNHITLIRKRDSTGTSFYFQKDGKPIYAKGANWIPGDVFLPRLKKADYRRMLLSAKNANMNMLRVWGGGIYEDDAFYDLCDSLGIMVWQDLMFAGGMYPGDDAFMNNVREEVIYQVTRLRKHPCIVLWCGNNEIDEAWHNWGWQDQFNIHGNDSVQRWNDYTRLFRDSLANWVHQLDPLRPYVSTSPQIGWGHEESFISGDSHYWGLWWGLEDWETFKTHTGRFVSEYGMQSMPNWNTLKGFSLPSDRQLFAPVIQAHQKANQGFKKLDHYLLRYFIDSTRLSALNLEDYTYLTQCMQYYVLKNSIAIHRSKQPNNMGTLLWQLNDCWPVVSWSITDYSRQPKAAWYAVREAYRDDPLPVNDSLTPKDLHLEKPIFSIKFTGNTIAISAQTLAKYVKLTVSDNETVFSDNYFDLLPGVTRHITLNAAKKTTITNAHITIKSLYDVLH